MGHTTHQAEPRGPGDTLDWRDLTVKILLVKRFMLYLKHLNGKTLTSSNVNNSNFIVREKP